MQYVGKARHERGDNKRSAAWRVRKYVLFSSEFSIAGSFSPQIGIILFLYLQVDYLGAKALRPHWIPLGWKKRSQELLLAVSNNIEATGAPSAPKLWALPTLQMKVEYKDGCKNYLG